MAIQVSARVAIFCLGLLWSTWVQAHPAVYEAAENAGVPPRLLAAVMMQESKGHPWTLNIDGTSFFLDSKKQAIDLIHLVQTNQWLVDVREPVERRYFAATKAEAESILQQSGRGSVRQVRPLMIDIGLMQINLYWHRENMPSLETALDPRWNLAYGANYLASLISREGHVGRAVGYYNANDPRKRAIYTRKVLEWYRRL